MVAMLATACAGNSRPEVSPRNPDGSEETLSQVIARLKAERLRGQGITTESSVERVIVPTRQESEEDRAVRLRAEQIRMEREEKAVREEVRKNDTPDMRQARKEIEKQKGRAKSLRKEETKVLARAGITGCENPVTINARAAQSSWLATMVTVRIVNQSSRFYNIETPSRGIGTAVANLCPGGSVTLSFAMNIILEDQYEDIVLMAVSRSGQEVVTEERRLSLYAGNVRFRRVDSQSWVLNR
jgi:hypothetical protein